MKTLLAQLTLKTFTGKNLSTHAQLTDLFLDSVENIEEFYTSWQTFLKILLSEQIFPLFWSVGFGGGFFCCFGGGVLCDGFFFLVSWSWMINVFCINIKILSPMDFIYLPTGASFVFLLKE